jgi:hypothetical protein
MICLFSLCGRSRRMGGRSSRLSSRQTVLSSFKDLKVTSSPCRSTRRDISRFRTRRVSSWPCVWMPALEIWFWITAGALEANHSLSLHSCTTRAKSTFTTSAKTFFFRQSKGLEGLVSRTVKSTTINRSSKTFWLGSVIGSCLMCLARGLGSCDAIQTCAGNSILKGSKNCQKFRRLF